MARVSIRVGVGRSTPWALAGAVLAGAVAAVVWHAALPGFLALVCLGFAALAVFFAFVHPHSVVALDEDDDPSRRVGDRVDD